MSHRENNVALFIEKALKYSSRDNQVAYRLLDLSLRFLGFSWSFFRETLIAFNLLINKIEKALDTKEGSQKNGSPGVLETSAERLTSGDPMLYTWRGRYFKLSQ